MVITFDTTGLQQVDATTWANPANGDRVGLVVNNRPLAEPVWLENWAGLRRNLAAEYAEMGCLIEAEAVMVGGVRAVCQVAKVPIPNAPSGQIFMANIFLAKADRHAMLVCSAAESGMTGMREAVLMAKLGVGMEGWLLPHPYDPELKTRLPYHRGDAWEWDAQFPDHPLTRVRAWVGLVLATATVDPAFAALPDFVPSSPASST
ncbi:hypothetical protein ACFQ07_26255 [Actinomadura adrarensis]|uniref:Uncharacterized protein n=1 Tax=Actinomadura adrarensis TaxID=1819600 RepID=A0ABW3CPQ0_9ACTN